MKRKHLMPEAGSRAHRIFVELARHEGPVGEHVLMERHGLDGLSPTVWRQGPYKTLASSALIVRAGRTAWQLSKLGRAVMDEVEAAMIGRGDGALVPAPADAALDSAKPAAAAPRGPCRSGRCPGRICRARAARAPMTTATSRAGTTSTNRKRRHEAADQGRRRLAQHGFV
jgi:hypothetical protein